MQIKIVLIWTTLSVIDWNKEATSYPLLYVKPCVNLLLILWNITKKGYIVYLLWKLTRAVIHMINYLMNFNRSQFFHYVCRCGQSKILLCCLNPFPLKTYFCTKTSWVILISVVFMVDSVAPQNQVKSLNIWMSWEMWRLKKMFDRVHFPHLIKWSCVKTKVLNRKLAFIKWKLFCGKI